MAVSTCDPPCKQQLAVAGVGAGSSFVITCFKGRWVSGDMVALGVAACTFVVGNWGQFSVFWVWCCMSICCGGSPALLFIIITP